MHGRGLAHRDIKPENLLCNTNSGYKFVDFGISKTVTSQKSQHTKNVVTRCYRPPELFFGDKHYDPFMVDMWSLGCVFAELFTR